MKLIDTYAVKLPEGFFEKVDNVPKFYDWINSLPTIEAIPISFIENRITELAKERNKYEIGTSQFRYVDMQIYYYEMLLEDWEPTLTHMDGGGEDETD